MERTTAEGHVNNKHSDGDPQQGIKASVLAALDFNNYQEEIINTIVGANIVPAAPQTQLRDAIIALVQTGGSSTAQIKIDPLLNNTAGEDIATLVFDKAKYAAVEFSFYCERSTNTAEEKRAEKGRGFAIYNNTLAVPAWEIGQIGYGIDLDDPNVNDAETTFGIGLQDGQVNYATTDFEGANYSGILYITEIKYTLI